MRRAWRAVKEMGMTQVAAAEQFGVPRSTLQVYLKKSIDEIPEDIHSGRFKPVFNELQEQQLVSDLIELNKRFYGMSRKALVQAAFKLAEANGLQHPFKPDRGEAGYDWAYGFLKRHADKLSIRAAQPISIARIFGYRKSVVYNFFDNLEEIVQNRQLQPSQILNCDETGTTVVMTRSPRVIAQRGARNVARIKPAERGTLVTIMACASASGVFLPPYFIFSGSKARMQDDKVNLGPAGSTSANSKRGWMDAELFIDWLQYFVHHVRPTRDRPVLLILDNLKAHITLNAIEYARENNVDMLTMPPHTSHRLQPLDVGFFGPLKGRLNEALIQWQNRNRYLKPTKYDIPAIIRVPYEQSAKPQTAVNAFSKTGIWVQSSGGPNRLVLNPDEFYPEDGHYNRQDAPGNEDGDGENDRDDNDDNDDDQYGGDNGNDDDQEGGDNGDDDDQNGGDNGLRSVEPRGDDDGSPDEPRRPEDSPESELDVYEGNQPTIESIDHYHLECSSRTPFSVAALTTADEDPVDQRLLESIIMFNRTESTQEASSDDCVGLQSPSSSSRSSARSINSTNVEEFPLVPLPSSVSNSTGQQQELLPPKNIQPLTTTLLELESPSQPVAPTTSSRQVQSELVTKSEYIEKRRQEHSAKNSQKTKKVSSQTPRTNKLTALQKGIAATKRSYAAIANASKPTLRMQPKRVAKKKK